MNLKLSKPWFRIHRHLPEFWSIKVRKGWYKADGTFLASKKSSIYCSVCNGTWRSFSKYVDRLPDYIVPT